MNNKLVRGTLFLTAATLISKILGFVYIIPFMNLVGDEGYALYKYAYGPYGLMNCWSTNWYYTEVHSKCCTAFIF